MSTIELNPKTIELCAVITFFIIGTIIGASLLDRLWLLGGIMSGWWASGAVHKDTRGGLLARKVGAEVTMLLREIHEKYNQAVIFYRTGKLAYVSSKVWDEYDKRYSIKKRLDELNKIAVNRASDFNTAFKEYGVYDQFNDIWKALQLAPTNAQEFNKKYGVTTSIYGFTKGLLSSASETTTYYINKGLGIEPKPKPINRNPFYYLFNRKSTHKSNDNNMASKCKHLLNQSLITIGLKEPEKKVINPWGTPYKPYKSDDYKKFIGKNKNKNKDSNNNIFSGFINWLREDSTNRPTYRFQS